ncbi:MAG: hypothetical protein AAGF12_34175 [Myxococcota bacterium]
MERRLRNNGERWDQLGLVQEASDIDRQAIMREGKPPEFDHLVGWEFAGINTGTLAAPVRKFIKGFYDGPSRGKGPEPFIQGYNIPVRQDGVQKPHRAKPSADRPKRFGFYRVYRPVSGVDQRYPNSIFLNYGLGGNPVVDPGSLLRDYVVQVYDDDPTLLLGHAFLALPFGARPSLSFFVLKRMHQHSFRG